MLKKLVVTFGTSVVIMGINIIGGILTARLLGPLGKGQLTAVAMWPGVLASIGNLGLVNAIVYFSGKESHEEIQRISAGSFSLGLIQTLFFATLGFFLLPILMHQYSPQLILMAKVYLIFIPLNIFTQFGIALLQGKLHITFYNIVRFIVPGSYLAIIIILALGNMVSVQACAVALLISNAIALLVELIYLLRVGWLGYKISFPLIRKMISYGLKSHIGNISALLNVRLDQMVMAIILPADMLGLYAVAVTTSSGVTLITDAIATISFPTISAKSTTHEKKKALCRSLRLSFWCSFVVTGIMLIVSNPIINILFGKVFSGALPSARVLIIAASILGVNMTLATGLKGFGRPGVSSVGEVISLCVTAVLLWLLLPLWGIMGAAVASFMAYSCNFLFMYIYTLIAFSIKSKETLLPQPEDYAVIREFRTNLKQNRHKISSSMFGKDF